MKTYKLLTREDFREKCLKRDNHRCVFCGSIENITVHHILERRLFTDSNEEGGYFENNGASVCPLCHIRCETTEISVEQVRDACGIKHYPIPEHLYPDQPYDKWGNPIMINGTRLKGELFHDESVQKILKQGGMLGLFTEYVKYSRSHHLPWSNMSEDDRMMQSVDRFIGKRVIVTEKLDGENFTGYADGKCHTRSLDSRNHPSRNWVKNFWNTICMDIPEGHRICGESLYAKHSIHYKNLDTYFYGFSMWNSRNICLSWDETIEWFQLLGITPVPILFDEIYDEKKIKTLWSSEKHDIMEGYVVRLADSFPYSDFKHSLGKFVRPNHIVTSRHWMFEKMEKNLLRIES